MDQLKFQLAIAKEHSDGERLYQVSKEHSLDSLWCTEKWFDNSYASSNLRLNWSVK